MLHLHLLLLLLEVPHAPELDVPHLMHLLLGDLLRMLVPHLCILLLCSKTRCQQVSQGKLGISRLEAFHCDRAVAPKRPVQRGGGLVYLLA